MSAKPTFFPTPADFRAWLEAHHDKFDELLVGFHRKRSGKTQHHLAGIGRRCSLLGSKEFERASTKPGTRFASLLAGSLAPWSAVNIKRVQQLKKMGLMHPAGLHVFAVRSTKNSGIYAYEQRKRARFTREQEKQLCANKAAGEFFRSQAPWCQRVSAWWVVSAKRKTQDASGFPGSSSICRIGALLPQLTRVKNK